jgi:hypothetical protein
VASGLPVVQWLGDSLDGTLVRVPRPLHQRLPESYAFGRFSIGYGLIGPTEVRAILIALNTALARRATCASSRGASPRPRGAECRPAATFFPQIARIRLTTPGGFV